MLQESHGEVINFTWRKVWMRTGLSKGVLEGSLFF